MSFRILTGGRAGGHFTPTSQEFIAGRHNDAELRFDPDADLAVSGRHARFRLAPEGWIVEDLDSRNGTFVNGQPVTFATAVREGDRVTFGAGGPEVEVVGRADARGHATLRVRAAVVRERRRAALVSGVLLAFMLLLVGALALVSSRSRSSLEYERATLELRIDSLIAEGHRVAASLAVEVNGLAEALHESEQQLRRLRAELAAPHDDHAELRQELLAAMSALRRQQLAASLDFDLIQRRARGAVAMVWIEHEDGHRTTGTAFAVRPDGLLLTNRHLVMGDEDGLPPRRMAVRFADSDQAFPTRVVAISRDWDLALLRVANVIGPVPVIPGWNARLDTLPPGSPVALIGYPLGGEPERDPTAVRRVARPVVSAALFLRTTPGAVEVQGLGAEGASGSPILDSTGQVIAVLFGGRNERGMQVLLAVPAAAAAAFVDSVF
jgi:S1-C subfamily serine protease